MTSDMLMTTCKNYVLERIYTYYKSAQFGASSTFVKDVGGKKQIHQYGRIDGVSSSVFLDRMSCAQSW